MTRFNKQIGKYLLVLMLMATSVFAATATETFEDDFDGGQVYTNNNGTLNFSAGWIDSQDADATTGRISIDDSNSMYSAPSTSTGIVIPVSFSTCLICACSAL